MRIAPARLLLIATAAVSMLTIAACGDDGPSRTDEVAERGADVMPFDLDATTHRFTPTPDGLDQIVVADDPDDETQVRLVREHLASEADRFQDGDFDDPAQIHGDDMPGLAELEAGAASIEIEYDDVDDGGALRFRTEVADLVDALHEWAEAQTSDHGEHAD